MHCKSCGKGYTGILKACPYCGNPTYENSVHSNKIATFLAKPREMGNLVVTNMNILLVLAINLSIAALIINLFTYEGGGLWCQYVSCGAFAIYSVLRGFFGTRTTALRTVRHAIVLAAVAMSASAIAYNAGGNRAAALNVAELVLPIMLLTLGAVALVFLFFGLATSGSFCFTVAFNTAVSTVLLIVSLVNDDFTSPTLIYVAFGFSLFMLANYALLRMLSFSTKVKRSF
ncbi:MAG: hypothetical protein IJW48_05410 [Clostridia bacterium]|nr:hypothetical protein [Clostridia bacterium]